VEWLKVKVLSLSPSTTTTTKKTIKHCKDVGCYYSSNIIV
jgi:hypothetical protein